MSEGEGQATSSVRLMIHTYGAIRGCAGVDGVQEQAFAILRARHSFSSSHATSSMDTCSRLRPVVLSLLILQCMVYRLMS